MSVYFTSCGSPLSLAAEHSGPFLSLLVVTLAYSSIPLYPLAPLMRRVLVVPLIKVTACAWSIYIAQAFGTGRRGTLKIQTRKQI